MEAGEHPFAWDDVRVFLALLDAGSFKEAARALGVNASTAARRLDALEEALKLRLFERSRGGILATAAAEQLTPAARHFARAAAAFGHAVSGLEREPTGEVVISAATGVSNLLVIPLLEGLAARHPGLRVRLDANNAFADLDRHQADLALRSTRADAPLVGGENLLARKLTSSPVVPVASPGYAAEVGPVTDLTALRWVTFGPRTSGFSWARKVLDTVPPEAILVRSDDSNAVFAAAMAGLGATWMNRIFVDGERLVELELSDALAHHVGAPDALWLVVHRALRDVPRVAAVWRYLADALSLRRTVI